MPPAEHIDHAKRTLLPPSWGGRGGLFRLFFGLIMAFGTARFVAVGWVEDHYIAPAFHFKYYGFEWVPVLPGPWLYAVHGLMFVAALGIAFGPWQRLAAAVFFLTFTYTELIDLTYYLNHYYFVSLAALLLIFLPLGPGEPRWAVRLIQFQLFVVYFHAGVAKINVDWLLHALPLRIWLPAHADLPLIGPLLQLPETAYVFSWAGMLFDTTIVFFLAWQRTRLFAYAAVVIFHTLTGLLFQIGIFPLVMMGSTLIFFSEKWHERCWSLVFGLWSLGGCTPKTKDQRPTPKDQHPPAFAGILIGAYMIFQLAFPWRYLLYPGNLFWTEDGYRFSWRVMLVEKAGTATFFVRDRRTGREGEVNNRDFLNSHQEKQMAYQPDLILQYAHFLRDHFAAQGVHDPMVRAEVYVTMNGRPSRLYFDPQLDLTTVRDGWGARRWLWTADGGR